MHPPSVYAKSKKVPTSKAKNESQGDAVQQVMPGMEISSEDILTFLKNRNVHYVDKRSNGGALWIIGGHELASLVAETKSMGIRHTPFTPIHTPNDTVRIKTCVEM